MVTLVPQVLVCRCELLIVQVTYYIAE